MIRRLFRRRPKREITILPEGITVIARGNRSILQSAKRSRVTFPHWCESGRCRQCSCRLVSGEVSSPHNKWERINKDDLPDEIILACQSVPATDVVIELAAPSPAEFARKSQ